MDTLCVPSGPGSIEIKVLAINAMAAIYKRADKVLVLDSDLDTVRCDATPIEIAIRIVISSWWTRLWVLQESMFARELWFQLKDGAVNEAMIRSRSEAEEANAETGDWSITQAITAEALGHISALNTIHRTISEDQGRHLLSRITWRFTTRASDEAVCLAILLDLPPKVLANIQDISDEEPVERLKAFILAQRAFPSIALFWGRDTVGNVDERGFRWASKAFVGRRSDQTTYILRDPNLYRRMPTTKDTAFADADGFHVNYPGLKICLPTGFLTHPGPPIRLPILNESDNGYYDIFLAVPPNSPINWSSVETMTGLAVVLPRPLAINDKDRVLQGVLVADYEEREYEIFSRYVCPLEVRLHYIPISEGHRAKLGTSYATAVSLGVGQKWCVG